MFTRLLVPVDGSEHAKRAVRAAADLARRYAASLILMHVLTHTGSAAVPEELRAYSALEHIRVTERDIIVGAAKELLNNAEALARENGVETCEVVMETGDPASRITDYARTHAVDLIVMGRRGLGDLSGFLLGSVSHKVAQATECSCLTIK